MMRCKDKFKLLKESCNKKYWEKKEEKKDNDKIDNKFF
jgi:hypothetical protein